MPMPGFAVILSFFFVYSTLEKDALCLFETLQIFLFEHQERGYHYTFLAFLVLLRWGICKLCDFQPLRFCLFQPGLLYCLNLYPRKDDLGYSIFCYRNGGKREVRPESPLSPTQKQIYENKTICNLREYIHNRELYLLATPSNQIHLRQFLFSSKMLQFAFLVYTLQAYRVSLGCYFKHSFIIGELSAFRLYVKQIIAQGVKSCLFPDLESVTITLKS